MEWTVMPSIQISSSSRDSANCCEIRLRCGTYYCLNVPHIESGAPDPGAVPVTPAPPTTVPSPAAGPAAAAVAPVGSVVAVGRSQAEEE